MKSAAKGQRVRSGESLKEVDLSVLKQRVTDLSLANPEKAALILRDWIRVEKVTPASESGHANKPALKRVK